MGMVVGITAFASHRKYSRVGLVISEVGSVCRFVLLKQNKAEDAEVQFRRVLEIDPDNAAATSALQLVAVRSGHDAVVEAQDAATSVDSTYESQAVSAVGDEASQGTTEQSLGAAVEHEVAGAAAAVSYEEGPSSEDGAVLEVAAVADAAGSAFEATAVDAAAHTDGSSGTSLGAAPAAASTKVRRFSVKPPPPFVPEPQQDVVDEDPLVDEHGKPLGLVQRMALKYQRQAEKTGNRVPVPKK